MEDKPRIQEVYVTSPKCFKIFLVLKLTYPENFMKTYSSISRNAVNRHTAAPTWETVTQSSQA